MPVYDHRPSVRQLQVIVRDIRGAPSIGHAMFVLLAIQTGAFLLSTRIISNRTCPSDNLDRGSARTEISGPDVAALLAIRAARRGAGRLGLFE